MPPLINLHHLASYETSSLFFLKKKIIPESESELQTKIQPQKHPKPDLKMVDRQEQVRLEAAWGDGGQQ